MTTRLDGLEKWERSIKEVTGKRRLTAFVELNTESNPKVIQALREMEQPEFFQRVLKRFVKRSFLGTGGILYKAYYSRAREGAAYWPHYLTPSSSKPHVFGLARKSGYENTHPTKTRYYSRVENMSSGFDALWKAISGNPQFRVEGSMAIADIGAWDVVGRLPLNAFMGMQGSMKSRSKYNSLFYAIEFGTGIEENVGSGYVRLDGETKVPEPPGAWWFGSPSNRSQGALFIGQKGFHFLYNERTRRPDEFYASELKRVMPTTIIEELRRVTE